MPRSKIVPILAVIGLVAAFALAAGAALAALGPQDPAADRAAALRHRFEELHGAIASNGFGRPVALVSHDQDHRLEGDVYALVDHPFAEVERALREPAQWCQVLVLPFNVKRCDARGGGALSMYIARKGESTAAETFELDFRFRVESLGEDFMRIALAADSGPLGTRDYRIALEATPADGRHTIIHLGYAYGYGMVSRLAMQAYLSTAGAHKVGFTVEGRDGSGRPVYVRGMRGVMERNTMRYFLAIEAYLDSLAAPPPARQDARIAQWFDASERYPLQLHEMDRDDYVAMKRRELHAANAGAPGSGPS